MADPLPQPFLLSTPNRSYPTPNDVISSRLFFPKTPLLDTTSINRPAMLPEETLPYKQLPSSYVLSEYFSTTKKPEPSSQSKPAEIVRPQPRMSFGRNSEQKLYTSHLVSNTDNPHKRLLGEYYDNLANFVKQIERAKSFLNRHTN